MCLSFIFCESEVIESARKDVMGDGGVSGSAKCAPFVFLYCCVQRVQNEYV